MPPSQSNSSSNNDLDLLSAYLDDQLTAAERGSLEKRLRTDPNLRLELEELRTVPHLLRNLEPLTPPRSFTLDPMQVAPRRLIFPGWVWLGSAFAAVLVLALAVGTFHPNSPTTVQMNSTLPMQETPPQVADAIVTSAVEPEPGMDMDDETFSADEESAPLAEEGAMAPADAPVEEAAGDAEIALSEDTEAAEAEEAVEGEAAADLAEMDAIATPPATRSPANAPVALDSGGGIAPDPSLPPVSSVQETFRPVPSPSPFARTDNAQTVIAEPSDEDGELADAGEVAGIPRPSAHSDETSVRHQAQHTALSQQSRETEPSATARETAEAHELAETRDQPAQPIPAVPETAPVAEEASTSPAVPRLLLVLVLVAGALALVMVWLVQRQRTQ